MNQIVLEFAQKYNLTRKGDTLFGLYGDYLLTLTGEAHLCRASFAVQIPDDVRQHLAAGFLSQPSFRQQYAVFASSVSEFDVTLSFRDTASDLEQCLGAVLEKLRSLEIDAAVCPYCGLAPEPDTGLRAMLDGVVFPMHWECFEEMHSSAAHFAEMNRRGNLPLGILGAILGGLLGAALWVLAGYFDRSSMWIGFFIGIGTEFGCILGHGPKTRLRPLLAVLFSAILIFLSQYLTLTLSLLRQIDYVELTFQEALELSQMLLQNAPEVSYDYFGNALMGLLFAIGGIFATEKDHALRHPPEISIPIRMEESP